MADPPRLSDAEIQSLRERHYNAEVVGVRVVHDDLSILRVRPDHGPPHFEPGQYTVLGLGNWEPRAAGTDEEHLSEEQQRKLLRRAYSFSCPMVDESGNLLPPSRVSFAEFYIALIRHADDHPPGLTPRLFLLEAGDRLFMGEKTTGHYTLQGLRPDDNVVFVGTGTGEAPHTTMVAHLLDAQHAGRIVCLTCVRYRQDLAYREVFESLDRRCENFRYLALTTREPENIDPEFPGYVGKRYVQNYFDSGDFERDAGFPLDPQNTQVYLCGNPAMIGAPLRGKTGPDRYPQPRGMVEVLESRGFHAGDARKPGNVRYEKYW